MKEIFRACEQIYLVFIVSSLYFICKHILFIINRIFLSISYFLTFRFFYKIITGHFSVFISFSLHLLSIPHFSSAVIAFPFPSSVFLSQFSHLYRFFLTFMLFSHKSKMEKSKREYKCRLI